MRSLGRKERTFWLGVTIVSSGLGAAIPFRGLHSIHPFLPMPAKGRKRRERNQQRAASAKASWLGSDGFNAARQINGGKAKRTDAEDRRVRKAVEEQQLSRREKMLKQMMMQQTETETTQKQQKQNDANGNHGVAKESTAAPEQTEKKDGKKKPVVVVVPQETMPDSKKQARRPSDVPIAKPKTLTSARKKAFLVAKKEKKRARKTQQTASSHGLDDAFFTRGLAEPPKLPQLKRRRTS